MVRLRTTDSTSDRLKEMVGEGAVEGTVVVAERQTQGRGRRGRAWVSPPGGLYFSVLLNPEPSEASLLSLLVGLAPLRVLRDNEFDAWLKWPNDVLVEGRKVGGVLSEALYRNDRFHLVVGVGLNVNVPERKLPKGIAPAAASLSSFSGRHIDKGALLSEVLLELSQIYESFNAGDADQLREEYRQACTTIGRTVEAATGKGEKVEGVALDITPEGFLLLEDRERVRHEIADATIRPK